MNGASPTAWSRSPPISAGSPNPPRLLRRNAPRNDRLSRHCERSEAIAQRGSGDVEKVYCVYILTNKHNRVLYTGVTGDLPARVHQHREKLMPGFTNRYNVSKLVYYEPADDASGAIAREK